MAGEKRSQRIEPVIEQRHRLTVDARHTLADQTRQRMEAEHLLLRVRAEYRDTIAFLSAGVGSQMNFDALQAAETRAQWLRQLDAHQSRTVSEAERREEAARNLVVARRMDERVLERLQERWQSEELRRRQAAEAAFLDEVATLRYGRRRQSSGVSR